MKKAIVIPFHNHVPMYDHKYFDVIYGYFLENLKKWANEFDKLYLLDSTWEFNQEDLRQLSMLEHDFEVIKVEPNLSYEQAYVQILPKIKDDAVLFMDNDMIVYKSGVIKEVFKKLENNDVVSILEAVGSLEKVVNKKWPELHGMTNFAIYFFGVKTELLRKTDRLDMATIHYPVGTYLEELDYNTKGGDWSESLGDATIKILGKGAKILEIEGDKENIIISEGKIVKQGGTEIGKQLGHYHVRAGSTPAFMLTHRNLGDRQTYQNFISSQPKSEYLRQLAWYWIANENPYYQVQTEDIMAVIKDCKVDRILWFEYLKEFKKFHGLEFKWKSH